MTEPAQAGCDYKTLQDTRPRQIENNSNNNNNENLKRVRNIGTLKPKADSKLYISYTPPNNRNTILTGPHFVCVLKMQLEKYNSHDYNDKK